MTEVQITCLEALKESSRNRTVLYHSLIFLSKINILRQIYPTSNLLRLKLGPWTEFRGRKKELTTNKKKAHPQTVWIS